MSKKVEEIENLIFDELEEKERLERQEPLVTKTERGLFLAEALYFTPPDNINSKNTKISSLELKRKFALEQEEREYKRKFYNQSWFHILITSVLSIITTVGATWFITKFIS